LTGQGGNNAIETAACLMNHLIPALEKSPTGRLGDAEIKSIFESVQTIRAPRVKSLIKKAHDRQRLEAMETPLLRLVAQYVVPKVGLSRVIASWIPIYCPAISLHHLPIPRRPRAVPYDDEVKNRDNDKPAFSGVPLVAAVSGVVISLVLYYSGWKPSTGFPFLSQ
jgi:hypothetical protein